MKNLLSILFIICMPVYGQTSGIVIHNIMRSQIAPNAGALFNLQVKAPVTEDDWIQLNKNVSALHNAAHSLKKLNTNTEWQQRVDAIDILSEMSIEQVKDRNVRGLSNTGNALYNLCESCHYQFFPKGKNL
jgi:hypothetical protein